MKRILALAVAAFFFTAAERPASAAPIIVDPLPANSFIVHAGLEWAWASPCLNGGCSSIVFHNGWRYATPTEWALRPLAEAFLDPAGNYVGFGGAMRCASRYFDNTHTHCDYQDADSVGTVWLNSGPLNGDQSSWSETWLVRGALAGVPVPGGLVLLLAGLAGLGVVRRRVA